MNKLIITIISVGNGDSILLEYRHTSTSSVFGLIDCNDSANLKSTHTYLKRFFEAKGINRNQGQAVFDFVLLSHAHADHISGLQDIIRTYGAKTVYYSKNIHWGGHAPFQQYLKRSSLAYKSVPIDNTFSSIPFGSASFSILWPLKDSTTDRNENNNSIVAVLSHLKNKFVFSGDAEFEVWNNARVVEALEKLQGIQVFKVPHHGADNGTIDPNTGEATWLNTIPDMKFAVISSHIKPYGHPKQSVVNQLRNTLTLNTVIDGDQNIEFSSDGNQVTVKYFQ